MPEPKRSDVSMPEYAPLTIVPDTVDPATTVSADFVQGFLKGAVEHGRSATQILRAADISKAAQDNPESRFDGRQLQRVFNTIIASLDDLYMGFVEARYKPVLNVAALKMSGDAQTLGESIRSRTAFRESVRDDVHYGFKVNKKQHEFALTVDDFNMLPGMDARLFYWLRLCTVYRYHSWWVGRKIKLNRVNFSTPEPEGDNAHLSIFNCEVNFNQPNNSIYFDDKYLNLPIIRTEAEILQNNVWIESYPNWFEVPGSDLSLARQVEQAIETLHKEGDFHPTIDLVAKRLRINSRSLREQLTRENEKFQQIKARVRKDAAISKLLSTSLPVSTVAWELGFAEPGDFSRDFKHWTGYSPTEYRRKYL